MIIDGKIISSSVKEKIKNEVETLKSQGINPGLVVIKVGNDPASAVYVRNKKRACEELGIYSEEYALPEQTTEKELLDLIKELNTREDIDGILCQLPLPKHLDETVVINAIAPEKDVDCFHPENVGKVLIGEDGFKPCTPAGVIEMLKHSGIEIAGKNCVVLGRSNIVGKPMALLLLAENGTVTVCHSRTKNLKDITKKADILVAAIGKAKFVTADMVKKGAVVIDVGINRDENGKLCGDVDFEKVSKKALAISPVPGGVGLMTVTMLMQNTLKSAKKKALKEVK